MTSRAASLLRPPPGAGGRRRRRSMPCGGLRWPAARRPRDRTAVLPRSAEAARGRQRAGTGAYQCGTGRHGQCL